MLKKLLIAFLLLQLALAGSVSGGAVETKIEKPVEQAIIIQQKTQEEEEAWRQLQQQLSVKLDSLQGQVDELTSMRGKLMTEVEITQKRVQQKKQQLADIRRIESEMEPFLSQLVVQLAEIPLQDLPFLESERATRIAKLQTTLRDPEISISEKYRKSMEALQIEAEYGLTIETYQEMIELEGQTMLANILRLGRLGLYYVNLDENGCGFYNISTQNWQPLPDSYVHALQNGVAMADKRRPVEFINVPLGRMVKQ